MLFVYLGRKCDLARFSGEKCMQLNFLHKIERNRVICWFSCGATSAVACKIAVQQFKNTNEILIAYCDTGSEHPDNYRFLKNCQDWFNHPIEILKHPKYKTVDEVIEKERYINGVQGAKCTQQLKIWHRKRIQRPEADLQVFGFDAGEVDRAFDFRQHNPEVKLYTPLIKRNLFKKDCLALIESQGIELPAVYKMGYKNANCIGCVKGGMGYWNKIRVDFPEVFKRRAEQERTIGRSCIKGLFLDELEPNRGRYQSEPEIECTGTCETAKKEIENCEL